MTNTKRNNIIYWIFTALLAIGMLQSGIFAVLKTKQWVDLVTALGYPVYFLYILGIWKILGVIAILVPGFKLLKEWAYAGFLFDYEVLDYTRIFIYPELEYKYFHNNLNESPATIQHNIFAFVLQFGIRADVSKF